MDTRNTIILHCLCVHMLWAQAAFNGLTLFSPNQGGQGQGGTNHSYLIDNDENVVHSWDHQRGAASMPYLLQDSTLVYPYRVANPTMTTGGVGGGVSTYNWDGDLLWYNEISNEIYQHHHDIQPLPNGNILVLAWEKHPAVQGAGSVYYGGAGKGWAEMGRSTVDNSLNVMWSEAVLEVEPVGSDGNIVWEWHLWDHLIQDVSSTLPNYGIVADHPELQDINFGNVGGNQGPTANADWKHFNAIAYNDVLDQIVLSSRHHGEVYIIDHSTTTEEAAGHTGGNSGKGGDFLYRWGNPQVYDRGTAAVQKLNHQHGVNWIPQGYPGSGNLILFNNDYVSAGQQSQSAVFEIETPLNDDGTYYLEPGQAYGPENPVWIHTGGFHSNVQSGAFRLPNGNTLITDANDSHMFEVTAEHSIVWDYDYPGGENSMIARAQKYPLNYLGGDFPEYILGDVNFDQIIDIFDVLIILDMAFGFGIYSPTPPADYIPNGVVNYADAFALVAYITNN